MDPMTPLLAAAMAGLINLGGDVLLVCCLNKGIAGAAFATAIAQVRLLSKTGLNSMSMLLGPARDCSFCWEMLIGMTAQILVLVKHWCHQRACPWVTGC